MEAVIGIGLGIIIIVGIQTACYKFIAWENYHKAVVIALLSAFLVTLAVMIIMKVAG